MGKGEIVAVCMSAEKHVQKEAVEEVFLVEDKGVEGDAHFGFGHRQVSLLADESVEKMRARGLADLRPGAFGENLVTRGIDLLSFAVGDRLRVGDKTLLEVTQIGKECVERCAIYYAAGDCIMPREGIFVRVLEGGKVKPGDEIRALRAMAAYRVAILTVSDKGSGGEREDLSGAALQEAVLGMGWRVEARDIVPDELGEIEARLRHYCDDMGVDLVLTTGGTGLSPRDLTPEATRRVIHREAPGFAEAMRAASLRVTPHAMLSRAASGIRGGTLIINLPGSPRGASENLEVILPALPHGLDKLRGDGGECAQP